MTTIQIWILSFIQGLTEFLPVSSSGHLIIVPHILGWQDQGLEIDVAVHMGTLCAVVGYFWRDLWAMVSDFICYCCRGFRREDFTVNVRLALILVVATIPAVIIGLALKRLGMDLVRKIEVVMITTAFFGVLLYLADRYQQRFHELKEVSWKMGVLIGCAQAVALIPGTSRSGICMTMGRFLNLDRPTAARFAFLLSIPSIFGAGVLTAVDVVKQGQPLLTWSIALAVILSMLFGLLAIRFMLTYVSRHSFLPFVVYRLLLAAVLFTLI